jgi:transitional endoplasmic reticulum ATPase
MVSQLLTEMDGIEDLKGILVLAATNRLDILDPAILRAGRFDFHLEISAPNESAREAIFRIHTRGKPIGPDVNLKNLAAASGGLVGADIESICRNAALSAIRSSIQSGGSDDTQVFITAKDFGIKNYTLSAVND